MPDNQPDPQGQQLPPAGTTPPPAAQPAPTLPTPLTPPAPTDGQQPPQPTPPTGVRDLLSKRGYDVSQIDSDDAAMDMLTQAVSSYQQGQPFIEIGQQAAQDWEAYQAWKVSQGQGELGQSQKPGTPQEPEDPWTWDLPEFDPSWNRHLDANGQIRPETPHMVVQKMQAYYDALAKKQQEFFSDPREVIRKALASDRQASETRYQELATKAAEEAVTKYHREHEAERYVQENLAKFYELDERGEPKIDLNTGRPVFTARGKAFAAHAERARREYGITDQGALQKYAADRLAEDEARGIFGEPNKETTPPAGPNGSEKRQTFLDQALAAQGSANRDGTLPDSTREPPQQPRFRSARQIVQEMVARGEI